MKAVLIFIGVAVLFYLLGAFVSWDWNPKAWDAELRVVFGGFGALTLSIWFILKN